MAAELLGDRAAVVQAVLDDYSSAPISAREKALFAFLEIVVRRSNHVTPADVDRVRAAGWSDEALYDAITVCALFKFYNTWIDATGVHDMPLAAYQLSGQRLAAAGYAPAAGEPSDDRHAGL